MRFLLLHIILFISGLCLRAQDQTHTFTIRDTSGQIIVSGLLSSFLPKKKDSHSTYHYFYKGQLFQVSGSYAGYVLHGPYQRFDTLNNLIEEGTFKYGRKEGTWKTWYQNGQLAASSSYKKGKKNGESNNFNRQGELIRITHYKNGLLNGRFEEYKNGQLVEKKVYKKGQVKTDHRKKKTIKKRVVKERAEEQSKKEKKENIPKDKSLTQPVNHPQLTTAKLQDIQVFVKSEKGKFLNDVSIKINKFQSGKEQYRQFGTTDANGRYQLSRDSTEYVLYFSKSGYDQQVFRVYPYEKRTSLNITLKKEVKCTKWRAKILQASFDYVIRNATIQIQDKNGRLIQQISSNQSGYFEYCFECGKNYELFVFKDKFLSVKEPITFNQDCIPSLNQGFRFYLSPEPQISPPIAQQEENINISPKEKSSQRLQVAKKSQSIPFYVVVGTFSKKKNAEKRLNEVKALGYQEAEIIQYIDSGLYAVSIGQFSNETKANKLRSNILKKDQIKSFVKKL